MTQTDMPSSPQPPESSNTAVKVIIGIVVLLCIAAAGLLFLQHKKVASRRTHHAGPTFKLEGPTVNVDLGGGVTVKMVRVPTGTFMMGSDDTDPAADVSEMDGNGKKHKVTIRNVLYVGETEITRAQYKAVMGYDPSAFKDAAKYPDAAANLQLPADQVSWGDAHKWCAEVQKRTGAAVRLPTEAEWEYACRAGTETPYSCGAKLTPEVAQFDTTNGGGAATTQSTGPKTTVAVGTHKPNAFGLHDMHGNVSEWVEDNFHDDYTGAPTDGEVAWKNPQATYLHVHRGGSFNNKAPTCRSAMREAGGSDTEPELRTSTIGFRVVITGPVAAPAAASAPTGRHRARHPATATAPAK